VGRLINAVVGKRRDFFRQIFYMSTLTDELLGIKADKFAVGDLVKTKNTSDAYNMPWLGVITTVTILKNTEGKTHNCYTIDWVDREATKILWYDWYDEDLHLVQSGAAC
jgi:hypothetical protein|tara:strand:- start:638 stop:964 length:327 start_codon:yes stop_codon:yes gene_type:complete